MSNSNPGLPMEGSLVEYPLPHILSVLEDANFDGVLRLTEASGVWLTDGQVYLAQSVASPALSDVLFSARVGPIIEIEQLLDDSTDVAEQLVQANPHSRTLVSRVLHEFNLNSLFELLVPSELDYEIVAGETHPVGGEFSEVTSELIGQAQNRLDIWTQIASHIPSTDLVFKLNHELPEGMESRSFDADEWRYVSLLDGTNSVADLITETGQSAFSVCSGLYRLLLEGIVVS